MDIEYGSKCPLDIHDICAKKIDPITITLRTGTVLQHSKLVKSREEWREKAVNRANENREHRKTKKRDAETIAALRAKIKNLEQAQATEGKKTTPIFPI